MRFDEADARARLRPSGYLRYAGDMAWRHSEAAGFGREWYAERSLAWLVRNVSLHIRRASRTAKLSVDHRGRRLAPRLGPASGGDAARQGRDEPAAGRVAAAESRFSEVVAVVDTDWVLLGRDGRPARMPAEIAAWLATEPTFERSRVLLPETPADATRLATRVRPLDVDPMGHMNNAAYLDVVDEVMAHLPPGARPGARRAPGGCLYRVGYLQPALPGAGLEVAAWRPDATSVACRICDGAGQS